MKKLLFALAVVALVVCALPLQASILIVVRDGESGGTAAALARSGEAITTEEMARVMGEAPAPVSTEVAITVSGVDDATANQVKQTFAESEGQLAERMLSALWMGGEAGGLMNETLSAALVVPPADDTQPGVDLHVDSSPNAFDELGRLLGFQRGKAAMEKAEAAWADGDAEAANELVSEAVARGESSDEIWRRAARLVLAMGDPDRCIRYLSMFAVLNNAGAQVELRDALYDPLRERQDFEFLEDSLLYRSEIVQ